MHKLDIILHPVRFRIIQQLLDGKESTAKQLAMQLKDITQATLYRQLDTLVKSDILKIVEENQIRGTIERVYALNFSAVNLANEDIKELSKEDHLQYFLFFTAQLTKNFEKYLEKEDIDFERDVVGYRQVALHLSQDQLQDFIAELRALIQKYDSLPPHPKQTKRLISTIILPEMEGYQDE